MSRDDYLFVERQTFHPIALVATVALALGGLALLVPIPDSDLPWPEGRGIPGVAMLLLSAFLLNMLRMTTWVDRTQIRVRFGTLVPVYIRRIPAERITSTRVVEYRPIREAGGWGMRWGRFEGNPARFLNARGDRGVLIEGEKLRLIVGSATPEKFAEAIDAARAASEEARRKHGAPGRPGTR